MFDLSRLALYIGFCATVILFSCLFVVVSSNSGSRNITLAVGTLLGAFIFLGTQLYYELRATEIKNAFGTEFSIDFERHIIEQYQYPLNMLNRDSVEIEANKSLNKTAFDGDGEKLWRDMPLWSLVAYLWTTQHDWQMSRTVITTASGTSSQWAYLSDKKDKTQCSKIEWPEIKSYLNQSGNILANIKPWGAAEFMCLPPGSTIEISSSAVQITNPFCTIRFDVDPRSMSMRNMLPGGGLILTADKRPRYQTRTGVIRSTIKSNPLRAQNTEMPKYQAWASDVVERARQWFGSPQPGENRVKSDFE